MRKPISSDLSDYKNRIIAAGGSISNASLTAHQAFVTTLKSSGVWNNLSEIATYAGSNLNAALVKLKYPSGIQSVLTNVNFVSTDYTENSGLNGNGLTKYLRTGWIASQQLASSFNAHISVYCRNQLNISLLNPTYLGAATGARFLIRRSPGSLIINNRIDSFIGSSTENNAYMVSSSGFICATNDTHNSGKIYMNSAMHNSDTSFTTEARPTQMR